MVSYLICELYLNKVATKIVAKNWERLQKLWNHSTVWFQHHSGLRLVKRDDWFWDVASQVFAILHPTLVLKIISLWSHLQNLSSLRILIILIWPSPKRKEINNASSNTKLDWYLTTSDAYKDIHHGDTFLLYTDKSEINAPFLLIAVFATSIINDQKPSI